MRPRKPFEEALKADAPEGIAAAVRLADLHAAITGPGETHRRRRSARQRGQGGAPRARSSRTRSSAPTRSAATFELAIAALLNDGAYEHAVKAVDAYTVARRERPGPR